MVIAEYPEDFIGVFSINYASMKYQSRNDQLNQLDGDKGRTDIGREQYTVGLQGSQRFRKVPFGERHSADLQ